MVDIFIDADCDLRLKKFFARYGIERLKIIQLAALGKRAREHCFHQDYVVTVGSRSLF